MDSQTQLDTFLELLGRLGVKVRSERLGGSGGGLCELRGKRVFFLDLDDDLATQLEACAGALAALPEADTTYLPPALRERVEEARQPPI